MKFLIYKSSKVFFNHIFIKNIVILIIKIFFFLRLIIDEIFSFLLWLGKKRVKIN